jgi:hypothetical protein
MRALVLALLLLAAVAAAPASAGTFHVYGLGLNGGGCPNGWQGQTFSPAKFRQTDYCSRWEIQSTRDGVPLARDEFAGASLFAGEGARFTGFSIRSWGEARNGAIWKMAMCAAPFAGCTSHIPQAGTWTDTEFQLGTLMPGASPIHARHLWAGVSCQASSCADSAAEGRAVQVHHAESHAIVEDYTPPGAPSVSGIADGWNSGERRLNYSASDAGSGVGSVTLTVDGSLHRTNVHSCTRLPAGGYQQPVPCLTSTGGDFALNEPGQLADGLHQLTVTARDAGGEAGTTTREFKVDNNAPSHPLGLAVAGGEGWRAENDFPIAWGNPDQGNGSPIVAAYYRIGSPPTSARDGVRIEGEAAATRLEAPGDGSWPVYLWLQDAAGNADAAQHSTAQLRLDSTAPALAFASERDPHNPAEVRVAASDAHSGVADGRIAIRRRGVAEWEWLETRREGTELIATVPDERLERGTYELQATASDAAGNGSTTASRADGRDMVLDLPLRGDTRVSAALAAGAGSARSQARVAYGRAAWLRGALRTGSTPLPGARLAVQSRSLAGGDWQPLTEVVTDADGRYAVRLPRGSSRELRVQFPGDRALRPAEGTARLVVRGWAALRLRPNRLRRGGTIAFRGRVGQHDAALPAGGKLVQIQYLDGRRWRPAVRLGRTDSRGRFEIRYRFRRISRPTRIWFRILVPAEGGWPYATGTSRVRVAYVRP